MEELEKFRDTYRWMAEEKLVELAKNPHDLRLEVLPILQEELMARGLNQQALLITRHLVKNTEHRKFRYRPYEEQHRLISEKLDAGLTPDRLKQELQEEGAQTMSIIDLVVEQRTQDALYRKQLLDDGLSEEQVSVKLQEKQLQDRLNPSKLKEHIQHRGQKDRYMGYSLLFFGVLMGLLSVESGGGGLVIAAVTIAVGFWRVAVGRQKQV